MVCLHVYICAIVCSFRNIKVFQIAFRKLSVLLLVLEAMVEEEKWGSSGG